MITEGVKPKSPARSATCRGFSFLSKESAPHKLPGNKGIIMLIIMEDGNIEFCFFAGRR
jgi:hypothetical protein